MTASVPGPAKRKTLSSQVAEELRARIEGGVYAPGDKLPTEQALVEKFGCSRTVIREAVATLRADGLLESRQGAGVYVLAPPASEETLTLFSHASDKISDIIEELELRIGIEVEAAGLAAARSSPAQEAAIQAELDHFAQLMAEGKSTDESDFRFHMAIAAATNNTRFKTFLEHIGRRMIPRVKLRTVMGGFDPLPNRDHTILQEHQAIADAIFASDVDSARAAMRRHLLIGIQRYRSLKRSAATPIAQED